MEQTLLEVNNLQVEFVSGEASIAVVKELSFAIKAGEMLAIVGESGSGKSVTSLALMGLLPSNAVLKGNVLFQKQNHKPINLLQIKGKEWQKLRGTDIAMVFQEPMTSLNPVFTCGYQVMEALQLHQQLTRAQAKQQAIQLFREVQLPDPEAMIDRYPHQISGGQKQRVMIAMAISCNPALLIADEPTTALDVTVQKTILTLINSIRKKIKMSVIFITHDLGLVADIADTVVVMHKGKIVEQGNSIEVLNNPAHPYTRALMACRPVLHKRGERLPVVSNYFSALQEFQPNIAPIAEDITTGTTPLSPVLTVADLKIYYPARKKLFTKSTGPFKAVDGVSFTVNKGEIVGLVGESGCGKTTLGRAILQLIPATAGKIILNGTDLCVLKKSALTPLRKDLQIVFQDPYGSLNPRLTIGNAIIEPMRVHGIGTNNSERKNKAMALLEKVNLNADHFNRYPHQFSGGQRQRICIARALALNPSFLIFDESVSALDVSVQAQVLNLINDLKKTFHFTAIFISHDLAVVRYISDRILVMQQGKIVEAGYSDSIYENPQHPYTKQLIDAIPGKTLLPPISR